MESFEIAKHLGESMSNLLKKGIILFGNEGL